MDAANQPSERLSDKPNDLASCEREPLQFIGSIQSIGGLLAFTINDHRIQAASENIQQVIGHAHKDVVSSKLEHVIGPGVTERVLAYVNELTALHNRVNFVFDLEGRKFDGAVFVTDGLGFIEFEPALPTEDYSEIVNKALVEMRGSHDLKNLATIACRTVQRVTGCDRVMMYRFLAPHQHGEVIAEHRVLSAHSYNQHRFPASDVPQIARDLYLRNNVRQIPDTELPTSKVIPSKNPLTGKDLNLSDSRLRAVSPIHLEYLRNMKVRCSFSFAVIVDGRLWGLIACHHLAEKRIPTSQRTAGELIANAFAGQARLVEASELQNQHVEFLTRLSSIFESIFGSEQASGELLRRHQAIFDAFRASGVAVVRENHVDFAGLCPPRSDLQKYAERFLKTMNENHVDLITTESLSQDFPELPQLPRLACGALAVRIDEKSIAFLFRPELIETIIWGGDPRKTLDRRNLQGRINPRTSFEAWEETIGLRSVPWTDYEVEGFRKVKELIFEKLRS